MNTKFSSPLRAIALTSGLAALLTTGCASVAVSNDALVRNTAFALGIDQGSFMVTDRKDDGVKTSYAVTTDSGKKFNCYVTGTFSVTGRVVSDALCSGSGRPAVSGAGNGGGASGGTCNALLKAAGRC